jgi:hypothetical protein
MLHKNVMKNQNISLFFQRAYKLGILLKRKTRTAHSFFTFF